MDLCALAGELWTDDVLGDGIDEDQTIEGFDLAPIRRALNSCVNIFNLYGRF